MLDTANVLHAYFIISACEMHFAMSIFKEEEK